MRLLNLPTTGTIITIIIISCIFSSSQSTNTLSRPPSTLYNQAPLIDNQITPQPKNNKESRIPYPDFSSPHAIRHFIYDILRTVANGLVDGYKEEVTYFKDYDCFSQAFQLAVQGQFTNFFYGIITFEWLFHPINSYNSIQWYSKLWGKELYMCGKELTQDMYLFFFKNNLILSFITVSVRFNLLLPLIMYNILKSGVNGVLLNVYGFWKPLGQILRYLIGKSPVRLW